MDGTLAHLPSLPAAVALPEVARATQADRRVRTARVARVAFGAVLAAGGLAVPATALLGHPVPAAQLLAATWIGAALAAGGVAVAGWFAPQRTRVGDALLLASFAWPVAGLALALPLSLHALVGNASASDFDRWADLSWAIVGHCHVALALMGVRRVERLVRGEHALSALAIYGITIGLAMVPGAVFLLIPPIVVALTGLPFLFLLWLPERWIARERAALRV